MKQPIGWNYLSESGILPAKRLAELCKETDELIAIFTTCVRNAKRKKVQ